ncbi:Na+/H+ antiporter subunit E [Pseudomonas boanensis]|uniref:Na+/H+ antiporter subunit E n=1 Tax=Metapseudomonas boanensis TaxID=2822138 RepID=UPI0035D4F061
MIRRLLPHPAESFLLLAVWLLLVGSVSFGHLLLGAFLSIVIPLLVQPLLIERPYRWHPLRLLRFLLMVMGDILVANFQVARLTLGPIERLQPVFVEVPIELDNELAISVLVSVVSLTPGSLSADLSTDRRTLLVHGLHVEDKVAMVAEIKGRYEAPLKEIFECLPT